MNKILINTKVCNSFYIFFYRTPAYKDLNITLPKTVFIQLERPSDGDCSDAKKFTYKPSDKIIGNIYMNIKKCANI